MSTRRRNLKPTVDRTWAPTKDVHMADPATSEGHPGPGQRSAARVRILDALIEICRELESTQRSPAARKACRDVRQWIEQRRRREGDARPGKEP